MRKRILWVAMASVVLAVAVLGVPLAYAVNRVVTDGEHSELQRLALRSAVSVSPQYQAGDPVELPQPETTVQLGVYDANGYRVSGTGPRRLEGYLSGALSGRALGGQTDGQLVEEVPVTSGERVIAVVRAASPASIVRSRVVKDWLVLGALCLLAAACAAVLAAWQSRRLVQPLRDLSMDANDLGEGNFAVQARQSDIEEVDAVSTALSRTAGRLKAMMDRERSFSAAASHQLRTPLTQLQLELESGLQGGDDVLRSSAEAAMAAADRLSQTVDDVLAIARVESSGQVFDASILLESCREQWLGPLAATNRPLRVSSEPELRVAASLPACRQVLHVLMDNALRHGVGAVSLTARRSHGAVAIDVADEGTARPFIVPDSGSLGLSLAQSLTQAQGGRLLVDQGGPGTRCTVLLRSAGGPEVVEVS